MLEETIAFKKIPTDHQNRFKDRISFLHFDKTKIIQSESGVVAVSEETTETGIKTIDIPVAGLAVLSLGYGTSITNAAMTSCVRSGCVVQFTGGNGIPLHTSATPLTNSSKWALAQAQVVSNHTEAKKVAKKFYTKQFGIDSFEGSITQMRGIEGSLVKKSYKLNANKYAVKNFKRDTKSEDNVNKSLNIMNGILYGVSASAVSALSMNPALGIIHRGNISSFLFDLADLYKINTSIPLSFQLAHEDPDNIMKLSRYKIRETIHDEKILANLFNFITRTFSNYTPDKEGERLIGISEEVVGQVNYHNDALLDKLVL